MLRRLKISVAVIPLVLLVFVGLAGCGSDIEKYRVPSMAMSPTLHEGEIIKVRLDFYSSHRPQRWDIALFEMKGGERAPFRIVGLPGESVSFASSGGLLINGRPVAKPAEMEEIKYMLNPGRAKGRGEWAKKFLVSHSVKLGPDEYYYLGDNPQANDSRLEGAASEDQLLGKVVKP
jgi:signal peptidase I